MSIDELIAALADSDDLEETIRTLFGQVSSALPARLAGILTQLHATSMDSQGAGLLVDEAFFHAHSQAAYLGRRLAGNEVPYSTLDAVYGLSVADEQAPYYEKFIQDVVQGRYTSDTGELDLEAIEARAGLYEQRVRGTANEAWANTLDPSELIDWVLGQEDDSNCSVCPQLASDGPYKPHELPTHPGNGETPCMVNCRCSLRSSSGVEGF